jgi:hypothetical protein
MDQGITLCKSVLGSRPVEAWIPRIDASYAGLNEPCRQAPWTDPDRLIPSGKGFVPTSSSLPVGAVLSELDLRNLAAQVLGTPAGQWIRDELGPRIVLDLDQVWIRRQYAPARYPKWHAPHSWHQDGALGFDFLAPLPSKLALPRLLEMVTCWIALGACGLDAPGLEFVTRRLDDLLQPAELLDQRLRSQFHPHEFWRPVLEAGDVLCFRGDVLHRTHVTPAMKADRTSIEIRFFPADRIPERLRFDRFIPIESAYREH